MSADAAPRATPSLAEHSARRRGRAGVPRALGGAGFRHGAGAHERGLFTWQEWAAALGAEIKRAQAAGDPDTGETYYHHWLAALERIVGAKGIADPALLSRNREAWRRACERTPHGAPIALAPGDFTD